MTREFLKDSARKWTDFSRTDQSKGLPMPPVQKPVPEGARTIALPPPVSASMPLGEAVAARKSRRSFSDAPISLEELSFLLWATQGVRDAANPARVFRTVPSAGNRHALETYIAVFRVEGLGEGLYRYLPLDHALVPVPGPDKLGKAVAGACLGQGFAGASAATFIWTAVPYRMEWRYSDVSYKVIALDAGHVCQNLYLACEALGCGTCAIAAYDQDLMDALLGLEGDDEFVIYAAPVGKL